MLGVARCSVIRSFATSVPVGLKGRTGSSTLRVATCNLAIRESLDETVARISLNLVKASVAAKRWVL